MTVTLPSQEEFIKIQKTGLLAHFVPEGWCMDLHGTCEEDRCDCHHSPQEAIHCTLWSGGHEADMMDAGDSEHSHMFCTKCAELKPSPLLKEIL